MRERNGKQTGGLRDGEGSRVAVVMCVAAAVSCGGSLSAWAGDHSHRSIFFVDEYGAVNDGSEDARAAIQAAINDATPGPAGTGGVVQFGAGVYKVVYSDATPDQAAFVIGKGIVIRGVGPGDPADPQSGGTVIQWEPSPNTVRPSLMKVGFTAANDNVVAGFGLEDLTIIAGAHPNGSGHVLWWSGVEASYLENVQILFEYADEGGAACLYMMSHASHPTTGNWFTNCRFVAPDQFSPGHGVYLFAAQGNSYVTDCNFVNCVFENGLAAGGDLKIEAAAPDPVENNNHSFVNCWFDWPSNPSNTNGALLLIESDRNKFVNCRLDGAVGDLALKMVDCRGTLFTGSISGNVTEEVTANPPSFAARTAAENAARIFDTDPTNGALLRMSYFTLNGYGPPHTPSVSDEGTLWYGKRAGSPSDPDSLFVYTDNGLKFAVLLENP